MIRVPSPLDDQTEKYVKETMDCGFAVHKALGPVTRSHYRNAFCLELSARNIPFECEKSVTVQYRDRPVAVHRLDLVVRGCVVVELKAVKMLKRVHEAQVLAYLKASRLPVGLLMNSAAQRLKEGFRRIFSNAFHRVFEFVESSCLRLSCFYRVVVFDRSSISCLFVALILSHSASISSSVAPSSVRPDGVKVLFELIESLRELLVRFSQRRFRLDAQPP